MFLCRREIGQSAQDFAVHFDNRFYLTLLRIQCGLGHESRHIFRIRFYFSLHLVLSSHELLRIFIASGEGQKSFGLGSLGRTGIVSQDFLHRVSSLIYFSQAIGRPRQIMQDRRIIWALASGFLQKAVRPRKIATLIRNLSENAGDLWISWRELARFLCVSESFLLVLKRSSIELRELSDGGSQL